ncbi:MAG: protein-L-isoaspartate O-methyltransferase [Rubrivivax sp.]|nr:protein-L-isoaspartate O-methyltransferase [Rubrivivax sp.]
MSVPGRRARSGFPLALDRLQPRSGTGGAPHTPVLRPQSPLAHAAHELARRAPPSGLGLDSAAVRRRMVERLRAGGLQQEDVLQALASIERHRFVDTALATQAYEDTSLPIGLQQTISKPSVVGHMLALLFDGAHARLHGNLGRVLEIGTGCGYQAALLLHLSSAVVSIERLQALHDKARANLDALRGSVRTDLRLVFGDGRLGHAPRAPYNSIVAAAGGEALPLAWSEQLAIGGRLVAPVGCGVAGLAGVAGNRGQRLLIVDRVGEGPAGLVMQHQDAVHFVPLKSGTE